MPIDYILPPAFAQLDSSGRRDLESHFGGLAMTADFVPPPVNYAFMCFTNRCGSDFLSQAIASGGLIPEFEEPFNAAHIIQKANAKGINSLQDYFRITVSELGRNNWFASKLGVEQLALFVQSGLLARIKSPLHFLLMERNDKLGQAISRSLAWQTQRWTSRQTSALPHSAAKYDRDGLTRGIARVSWENALFQSFFVSNAIAPIHLSYEELVTDLPLAATKIGQRLGVDLPPSDPSRVVVQKLANATNAEWRRRYITGV